MIKLGLEAGSSRPPHVINILRSDRIPTAHQLASISAAMLILLLSFAVSDFPG